MKFLAIVALAVAAAVSYGILHDQITAHICVEYFTIGHPPVFRTQSPTLLALGWGVIATWWVGLPLGYLLAASARFGNRPRLEPRQLVRPIGVLLLVMGTSALIAGTVGGYRASHGLAWLTEPLASAVPREAHNRFLIDLWAHNASYATGIVGGICLALWIWHMRGRPQTRRSA